jgi:hypothetical protein
MGNELSQEEEAQILEEAYKLSLDSPEVDKKINVGTTAPNCQPKHTMDAQDDSSSEEEENGTVAAAHAAKKRHGAHNELEIVLSNDSDNVKDVEIHGTGANSNGSGKNGDHKHPRSASENSSRNGNATRQHQPRSRRASGQNAASDDPAKMGYFSMAKAGYQELINAIIRPPRAEYKVRSFDSIP